MQTIHLYLGAHKTATTHLTGIMNANRDVLTGAGITLSTPSDIRKEWLPKLFFLAREKRYNNPLPDDVVAAVQAACPAQGNWILSEENMVGVASDLKRPGGIYRFGPNRIAMMRTLFPDAKIRLFFSIRSFETFYRSMYSEEVRNAGYLPFSEYYDPEIYAERSWTETLSRFTKVLPQEDIVLWRFEDFRQVMPSVLREMTGIEDVDPLIARYERGTTRPSLSQKTLDLLGDLAPAVGKNAALELTEQINQHYAVADGFAPFQPFDDATIVSMREKYDADFSELVQRFPKMDVVRAKADA
ncbi:MAG: hypothetical protein ABJD13_20005 [Paracoccaceae bacterium]